MSASLRRHDGWSPGRRHRRGQYRYRRGIARADDDDLATNRRVAIRVGLEVFDESEGVDHARQILARDPEALRTPEPDPDEHGIVLAQQRIDGSNRYARFQFDTEIEYVLHLRQRDIGFELVLGDAEGVEPAGLFPSFEHRHGVAGTAQIARAREPCRSRT